MDQNRIEGNRKLLVGKVTEKWCKLSEDDSAALNGKHERLEGKIQQLYGHGNHQVTDQVTRSKKAQTGEYPDETAHNSNYRGTYRCGGCVRISLLSEDE